MARFELNRTSDYHYIRTDKQAEILVGQALGHLWLHPETVPIRGVIDHRNQPKQVAQEQGGEELIVQKGVIEKAVAKPQKRPKPTDFVDRNLCKQMKSW